MSTAWSWASVLAPVEADTNTKGVSDLSTCPKQGETGQVDRLIPPLKSNPPDAARHGWELLGFFLDDIEATAVTLQMNTPDEYRNRESAIAAAYEICRAKWLNRKEQ